MVLIKNKSFILCLIFLILGFIAGFMASSFFSLLHNSSGNSNLSNLINDSEFHTGGYKFINPLLECRNSEYQGVREYNDLENRLTQYIQSKTTSGDLSEGAIYFRDLSNGPWFGVNEKADFAPSSLLKLPVMMAYYAQADDDPGILSKKILFDKMPEGVIQQEIKGKENLVIGQTYTVEDLIERMIQSSDNVSLRLLEDNINNSLIDKVTLDLGIPTATDSTPDDFMSVKDYSTLFRILYNASYLSKKMSEKALEILANAEYNQGLTASIPRDITVAHKFGEREDGSINQLHDCGIIYYPNHSYLLCVMTRGKDDLTTLSGFIRAISLQVFQEVDKRYGRH